MFNSTFNYTITEAEKIMYHDTYEDNYSIGKFLFLVPIILFGSFTVLVCLRFCKSKN